MVRSARGKEEFKMINWEGGSASKGLIAGGPKGRKRWKASHFILFPTRIILYLLSLHEYVKRMRWCLTRPSFAILPFLELVFIFWFLKTHFCQVSLVTNSNPAPMSNINHTGRWFMDRSLINALESGFCLQSSQLYLVQGKIHSSWQF